MPAFVACLHWWTRVRPTHCQWGDTRMVVMLRYRPHASFCRLPPLVDSCAPHESSMSRPEAWRRLAGDGAGDVGIAEAGSVSSARAVAAVGGRAGAAGSAVIGRHMRPCV